MPNDFKIDSKAFLSPEIQAQLSSVLGQGLVSPVSQPSPTMGEGFVPDTARPSSENLAGAEENLAFARKMGAGEGFGALGGGIASLVLAPKVAKLRKEANDTQVKAENLKLEQAFLQNKKVRNEISLQEKELENAAGMDALARIESGASENIQEDIRLAGGELTENGMPKTNWQKAMELQKSGQMPAELDLEEVAKFAPGIIMRMGQKYSKFTNESVIKELNDAGKQYRAYTDSLLDLRQAGIRAASKSNPSANNNEFRKNFSAYGTVVGNLGRLLDNVSSDVTMGAINPQAVEEIKGMVFEGLKVANDFAVKTGVAPKSGMPTPEKVNEALEETKRTGNTQKLSTIKSQLGESVTKAQSLSTKPLNSPDRKKDTKPPPIIATPLADSKKEKKKTKSEMEAEALLQGLGGALE